MSRFWLLTYITPQSSLAGIALEFFRHYFGNINPWTLIVTGELNIRDHVGTMGSMLAPTALLALLGLALVLRYQRHDAWWRFIIYALAVSVIPASLTTTEFPQIRLIAVPVLMHVFLIPAVSWLCYGAEVLDPEHRVGRTRPIQTRGRSAIGTVVLSLCVVLVLVQGAIFRWQFHRAGPQRGYVFDEQFPREVFPTALALNKNPIYLHDPPGKSGYIQAYWYGRLQGLDESHFVRTQPGGVLPPGSVVISTEEECKDCRLVLKSINYIVYVAGTPDSR